MGGTTYTFANRGESTITANWTPHTYTVAYDANGGTGAPDNQTKTYGTNLTLSSTTPTRTGYTFDGWDIYVGNTSQNAHIAAGGTLSTDYVSAQGATVTLKAKWNAKTWNVIFNGNGKTSGTMNNQQFTSGTAQNLTANAYERKNTVTWKYNGATGGNSTASSTVTYSFDGWSESAGSASSSGTTTTIGGTKKYDNQASVNLARESDYTLYARWKTTANSVTTPNPTKNGYDFGGWWADSGFTTGYKAGNVTIQPVTSSYNMYAKWTQHAYTITYKDSLDSTYSSTQTYYIENSAGATIKAALSKTGYDWAGWKCTSATAPHNWTANQIYTAGTSLTNKYGDVTLTAQWNGHQYTVAYNGNKPNGASGSVTGVPGSQTKTYGTNLTLTSSKPSLTGWTFTGWNTAADGSGTTYAAGGTLDHDYASASGATVTLYAKWSRNTYTVHFNGNGSTSGSTGDASGNQAFTYDTAQQLSPNGFIRSYRVTYKYNYTNSPADTTADAAATFNGWATSASGAKVYNDKQSVTNLATSGTFQLYANWTLNSVTLPTPTRTGYDFDGWYDAATGGTKIGNGGASYTPEANITLYAHWTKQTYKFAYNANTPSNATASVDMHGLTNTQKTYSVNVNLSSTQPTLTGWTFAGWNTKADGTGTTFAAGALINNDDLFPGKNGTVNLYAKWTANTYTIHFNSSLKTGGSMTDQGPLAYDADHTLSANGFNRAYTVRYNENYSGPSIHQETATYNIKGWTTTNKESTRDAAVNYANQGTVRNLTATDGGTAQLYIVWKDGGVELDSYSRTGYQLEGWYTDSDCTAANRIGAPGDTYYPTADILLYAHWVEHTYDIIYDANNATSGTAPATQENCGYLHAVTLRANTGNLQKTGYTLTGWNRNASGGAATHFDLGQSGVEGLTMEESITLYAEWTANNYSVTFHMNDGGTVTSVTTQTYDSAWVNVPSEWSRTGYTLEGWYTDSACTEGNKVTVTGNYTHAGNRDLYAHWVGLTYNVVYNKNTTDTVTGMPSPNTVTKRYGTSITLPAAPSRTGYTFKGWDLNENATVGAYAAGTGFNADPADMTQDGTLNFYAIWAPVTYTIRYDGNAPTGITVSNVPGDQTKTYDTALTLSSTEPGRTGYTFSGWTTVSDGSGTAYAKGGSMTVDHANTQDAVVTLYAQWTPIHYEVAFAGGGATGTTTQPNGGTMPNQGFDYDEEKALSSNTYERKYTVTYDYNYDIADGSDVAEYTFSNWSGMVGGLPVTYTDGHLAKNLTSENGAVITLTAQWDPDDVTLPVPTRDGYSFEGWYLNEGCTGTSYAGGSSYTPAGDITLYAKWTAVRYKITYTDSLASVNENASGEAYYYITAATTDGAVAAIKTPVKTGYDFAGWNVASNGGNWNAASYAGDTSVEGKYGAVTLQAQWTQHTYTVAYNANLPEDSKGVTTAGTAGSMPSPSSVTKTYGTDINLDAATPTLTGYSFVGWNTNADETTAEYAPNAVFDDTHYPGKNGTVTLYAIWAPYTYTVNYNGNGNTGGNTASQNATYDVYFDLNENGFVRSHTVTYKYLDGRADTTDSAAASFANWSFGGNTYTDGQEVVNLTSAQNGSVTLTANWTFGSVTLPTPTRPGYEFKGWYKEDTFTTFAGNGDASYTLSTNTDLYAKWEALTYTVEYYAGEGGSGNRPANQSVVYDTLGVNAYADEGSFVKPGYSFTGWNTAADGSGDAVPANHAFTNTNLTTWADENDVIKLYAQWTPNTYVIVYDKGAGTSGSTGSQTIRYDLLGSFAVAENGFSYPGYTFTEWKAENNATYSEGAAVTSALLLDNGVLNTGDGYYYLTLTAQWRRNQSTLHVDHDNNDAVIEVTQDSGTTYNVDGSFTKTGYTFTGWSLTGQNGAPNGSVSDLTSKATVYTFGNAHFVTDTLTAQWSKNPYTLRYHYNVDGAPSSEKTETVYYDTEFTFAPEDYFGYRLGYTIDGWATSENGALVYDCGQVSPATENLATGEEGSTVVDLYAVWTAKQYTVRFYKNTGFHFTEDASAEYIEKTITYGGSQTFTVQLEDGYTQSTGRDPAAYVDEGTAAVPDGVKDTSNNTIRFTVTNHGESNVVVRTHPLDLNTYTVTLIPASESWDEAEMGYRRPTVQATVTHGSSVTYSIELNNGFHVDSGSDLIVSATVGGTSVTPAVSGSYTYTVANATGDVVITMTNAVKNTSTVRFDANGGKWPDNTTVQTDTNTYGATYTVTQPSRTGYTFAGWTRVTEGENASTAAGSLVGNTYTYGTAAGTDTYAAQWTANTYTVVFDGNNGTPNTQTKTATYGQQWPTPDTEPTRTGYDFGGWCVDAEGTTPVNLSQNYMLTDGTTVYAKWTKHQYSISLDGTPDGYTVEYPHNALYGDNYTITITPETGFDVNAIDVNVTGNAGFTTSISGDVMTVSVTGVNDDNVITVSGAQLTYNVVTNLLNPEAFAEQPAVVTVTYNTSGVTVEVQMADGWQNTTPTLTMETTQAGLTSSIALKEGTDDTYVIAVTGNIISDVTLNVTGHENIYDVTLNKGTGFVAPATETGFVAYLGYVMFTVELADGYTDTQVSDLSVSVTNGILDTLIKTDDTHIMVVAQSTVPADMEIDLGDLVANTYTLTFINNGGDTLTINTPVPATSAPIGWFDTFTFSITLAEGYTAATPELTSDNSGVTSIVASKEGNVVTYTVKDYFTGNTVLTLQSAAANTSKVTVYLDGGTLTGVADGDEYTGAYKATKSFGTPLKTGYTFTGWALTSEGTVNGSLSGSTYTFGPTADAEDILTATWTANTYTVTFDGNGGVPTTQTATATYNAAYPTAADPTRTGYDFAGWFTAAEGGTQITLGTTVYTLTSATTLYAHWNIHESTLTVDPNGGKVVVGTTEYSSAHDFDGAYLDTLTVNDPTKTGYDFAGWTRTGNNGTLSGTTYTFGPNETDDSLTATWTPKTYTVTYYKNDGTADYTTRTVTYNAAWPEAPIVTWAGHTFDGWFTAADDTGSQVTFTGNYTTAGNTSVYAHWHINHSYVLFSFDGATMTVGENAYTGSFSANGDSGDTVTIAAPLKTGYTFTGWTRTTAANGTLDGNTYTFGNAAGAAEAPETFVAQFTANTYTVTFDGNDGTPNSQTATATYGVAYPEPATAVTRTGYTFAGWWTAAEGGSEITLGTTVYNLTSSTTLYAHWTIHTSTVTVKANGGNWSGSTADLSYTQDYGTAKTIDEPTRTGYTFTGWTLTSEGTVNGSISGNTYTFGPADGANDILTAQWQINTSKVIVDLAGGTGATEGAYTDAYGETLTLSEPTKTGYTFNGWTLSSGANGMLSGSTYTFGEANGTTDTITAKWTIHTSKVTVDQNGGAGGTEGEYTQDYNTMLTLTQPTKTGYTFNGWVLGGDENGTLSGNTYTFGAGDGKADTLTAQWTANTYTVVYDGNGGVPTTQSKTATYNAAYPTVTEPTRTGYTFAGWWTAAENGDQIVPGTTLYTLTTGTTLYAHWTIHTSKVNVVLDGGTGATEGEYTQNYNTTLELSEPSKTGYTFTGWAL
ncbi:MAG: InlB B-repeat-containing protein, partial [Clostridia bacterium]|nr:InlB B-repeat-containing protein [Clostridia bacterium]